MNRAETLGDALRSVQGQKWANVEHIVIDGGSTDGTRGILEAHRNKIAKLVSEPDKGLYDALN
jgi:glycosyltransferase